MKASLILVCLLFCLRSTQAQTPFVTVEKQQFYLNGKPYYYIGTNYWYGGLLGLDKQKNGIARLRKELDFLKAQGVTNVRVMGGAEGAGMINGVQRVAPALQTKQGVFSAGVLDGLDILLQELGKRQMKAVLFLSNNWEWSGGFQQYLIWNNRVPDSLKTRKLNWDEQRDIVSKFYDCSPCKDSYLKQIKYILGRKNKLTGKLYINDPAIMAWELANEPRPMRPKANMLYSQWINDVADFIKSVDKNHLVTTGHEGQMATDNDIDLYKQVHAFKNIDYLTIHIWPKNWGWFKEASMQADIPQVISQTENYIAKHQQVAIQLQKPLVVEEFGLPRDNHSFSIASTTTLRDTYYNAIFSQWSKSKKENGVLAGCNFWAFGGSARPVERQVFWKGGDALMGDPPMEEQGLNSVFDSDKSTWQLINAFTGISMAMPGIRPKPLPTDKKATTETVNLYNSLGKLVQKGVMFGHQDDLAYGVNWKGIPGKSDVKDVAGDYPAVYGWELGNLEHDSAHNLDSVPFDKMKGYIKEGYQRGGIITITWHNDNLLNGQSSWDTTHGSVAAILPAGAKHLLYKTWLDKIAAFMLSLKGSKGEYIPVLFRPYHEHTGSWFWWGQKECTPEEYKQLWRFTVDYLKNTKGVHNLLYVFNTAGDFNSKEEFLERYPGDDVVDMVSFDSYAYGSPANAPGFAQKLDVRLGILEEVANERGKIPTLAETGYETTPAADWWTSTLLKAIGDHKISYVLLWRNAGLQSNGNMHYYTPVKGDVSERDFIRFYNSPKTLFEKDVKSESVYH